MAKKRKKKPIGKLKKEAATLFQKLRRMECADDDGYGTCCTSGVRLHWTEGDGGHFIERGKSGTLLDERNVHLQSKGDNGFRMKTTEGVLDYKNFIVDFYGQETLDELIELSHKTVKWNRCDLEDKILEYKARIKEQEERIG